MDRQRGGRGGSHTRGGGGGRGGTHARGGGGGRGGSHARGGGSSRGRGSFSEADRRQRQPKSLTLDHLTRDKRYIPVAKSNSMPFEELKVRNKFARQRKHLEAALHATDEDRDADGDSDNGLPAMPSSSSSSAAAAAAAAAPAAPQVVDTRKGAHAKQTSAGKSFYDVYFSSDATMDEFQQEREQKLRQFAAPRKRNAGSDEVQRKRVKDARGARDDDVDDDVSDGAESEDESADERTRSVTPRGQAPGAAKAATAPARREKDPFAQARSLYEAQQEEQRRRRAAHEEHHKQVRQQQAVRHAKRQQLSKRSAKGQPLMGSVVAGLLAKIERG